MFLDDSVDAFDRSIHPLGLDMRGHQVRRRGFEHLDATTVLVQRRNLFRQHAEGRPGNQMLIVFQGHQQNLAAFRQHMQHGPQFGHGARMPTRPVHPGQTPRRPRSDHRRSAQKSHHNIKCWSAFVSRQRTLCPTSKVLVTLCEIGCQCDVGQIDTTPAMTLFSQPTLCRTWVQIPQTREIIRDPSSIW